MELMKFIYFCEYFSLVYGIIYTGKFTATQSTWSSARQANNLVGYDVSGNLSDIKVTVEGAFSGNTYGWIDGLSAYQPWYEYLGCYVISSTKVKKTVSVSRGSQVHECVASCDSSWTHFGVQQNKCVCLDVITPDSSDVISQCTTSFCTDDTYAFCSADNPLHQYAVYKKSPDGRSIRSGVGGCLVMTINRNLSPSVYYESAPCSTGLKPICFKDGRTYYFTTGTNWNGAFDACVSATAVMTSPYMIAGSTIVTPDGSYWLAQIRKSRFYLYKDFITGTDNYCLAARVMANGYLDVIERSCDTTLPGLYYTNITGMPGPGETNTTANGGVTTDPKGPRVKSPPLSDGLFAAVVLLPSMAVLCIVAFIVWLVYTYGKCCNKMQEKGSKFSEPCTSNFETTDLDMTPKVQNGESEYFEIDPTYYVIGSDTYTEVKDAYAQAKDVPINNSPIKRDPDVDNYTGSDYSGNYHTLTRDKHVVIDTKDTKTSEYHTLTRGTNLADGNHGNDISTYDRMSSIRRAEQKSNTSSISSESDSIKHASGNYDKVVIHENNPSDSEYKFVVIPDNYDTVTIESDNQPEEDDSYDHLNKVI